jgi:hypothetical protein
MKFAAERGVFKAESERPANFAPATKPARSTRTMLDSGEKSFLWDNSETAALQKQGDCEFDPYFPSHSPRWAGRLLTRRLPVLFAGCHGL